MLGYEISVAWAWGFELIVNTLHSPEAGGSGAGSIAVAGRAALSCGGGGGGMVVNRLGDGGAAAAIATVGWAALPFGGGGGGTVVNCLGGGAQCALGSTRSCDSGLGKSCS